MDIKDKDITHEDLEERFQISAKVDFESHAPEFEGLKPMNVSKVKKKEVKNDKIENIEFGKPSTGGLF